MIQIGRVQQARNDALLAKSNIINAVIVDVASRDDRTQARIPPQEAEGAVERKLSLEECLACNDLETFALFKRAGIYGRAVRRCGKVIRPKDHETRRCPLPECKLGLVIEFAGRCLIVVKELVELPVPVQVAQIVEVRVNCATGVRVHGVQTNIVETVSIDIA